MVEFLYQLAKAARVRQWVKNLVLFAAITFTGKLFDWQFFSITLGAVAVFCFLTGGIYLLNDIVDAPSDRLHPFKRNRPIAKGTISVPTALTASICAIVIALATSFLFFSTAFFLVVLGFLILQVAYTFVLKHITLIDVLAIATAFILRVYAGEAATGFHLNIWLFLTVVSVAVFLALGKRRSELTLLAGSDVVPKTRATLSHYSEKMLDVYLSMFSTATWLTYTLYTFLAKPPTFRRVLSGFLEDNLSLLAADRKWLMVTIPLVIYGVMRYLQLIYEKQEGESPEKVLLSDRPLLLTVGSWGLLIILINYVLSK